MTVPQDRTSHANRRMRGAHGHRQALALIGRYLRAGVPVGDLIRASAIGTPQGGPLSPLRVTHSPGANSVARSAPAGGAPGRARNNILLDDLDGALERRGHRFARYADDRLILVRNRRAGVRVKASITRYLDRVLRLSVNEQKSRVCRTNDVVFLGFTFRGTKLRWSDTAFDDFQHRIRRLTGRSWGVSMAHRLDPLARYLRGWMNYFGISEDYRPVPELDGWHASQGLLSVRDLWMKAHGYA